VRWADGVIIPVMDGLMPIPPILLAVALMALTRGSVGNVITAITVAEIPGVSCLVRSVVLSLREQPLASRVRRSRLRGPEDPSLVFTVIQSTGVRADLRDNYLSQCKSCPPVMPKVAMPHKEKSDVSRPFS
jgi:ABC-type antimicrobial peptide transport system permease subunit